MPTQSTEGVDLMLNQIIESLNLIKRHLPNGELKSIQERIKNIDASQSNMQDDLSLIKEQLLNPEDGVVVRVNKNTKFRKKLEVEEKAYSTYIDEHKELMTFKKTATRVIWIIFTSIASIIVAMLIGQTK